MMRPSRTMKRSALFAPIIGIFSLMLIFKTLSTSNRVTVTSNIASNGWVHRVDALKVLRPLIRNPSFYKEKSEVKKYFSWPTPYHPQIPEDVTDAKQSSFKFIVNDHVYLDKYMVGNELAIKIITRNGRGEQKAFGGDYMRVLLSSEDKRNSICGSVRDHDDGSYTATVPLHFSGTLFLQVILIHPSEAVDLLRRITSSKGSPGLKFMGLFQDKMSEEEKECNIWLPSLINTTKDDLRTKFCNFTHPKTKEPWICEKPAYLECSAIKLFKVSRTHDGSALLASSKLFEQAVNFRVPIGETVVIQVGEKAENYKPSRQPPCKYLEAGSLPPRPGGFFLQDKWQSLHCKAKNFVSSVTEAQCLKDKTIHFLGDSTIRQWYSYYINAAPVNTMKNASANLFNGMGLSTPVSPVEKLTFSSFWEPREAVDSINNISFHFSAHGPPLQNGGSLHNMPYIADRIDMIEGGPDTIVAVTIGTHLLLYDPIVFVRRLKTIEKAVNRLMQRAPGTRVLFKGFNVFYMDDMKANQCCLSDWLSLRLDTIARNMVKDMDGVIYLDMWDMSAAHYSIPAGLYTQPNVVQNEVALFLSFVCPDL